VRGLAHGWHVLGGEDALMDGKPYELKPDERPSVRNLWERYRDLEEHFPSDLSGEALSFFHDCCSTVSV
jgi:hypothetical protein